MKPYSLIPGQFADVGCCPGHDWPRTRRFAGIYGSTNSARASSKINKKAKRIRRHVEKNSLKLEILGI